MLNTRLIMTSSNWSFGIISLVSFQGGLYPTHASSSQNCLTIMVVSLTKVIFRKYLMENCSSELYLQLSSKYFSNLSSIPKLSSKVWQVQTREILTVQASLIYDMIDSVMKGSTSWMGCFQKVQIVHLEWIVKIR